MKNVINQKYFCAVPFTTLILNPDGTVGTCRELGTEHIVGDLTKQSLDEVWNGTPLQKLRQELISGKIEICRHHQCNKNCNKLNGNRLLANYLVDTNPVTQNKILRLSPDFNSECNLRCTMCDIWYGPNGLYDKINFWPTLQQKIIPNLLELDPLSGEPFIQEDLYRLIDIVVKENPNISWKFTTNGHWELTEKIKHYLNKIKIQYISISIDSVNPETYKKIRKGHLAVVEKNIADLIEFEKKQYKNGSFDIYINFTVHKDNWFEVDDMIKYAQDHNLKYFPQYLILPEKLSILSLPYQERLEIMQYFLSKLPSSSLLKCHRFLRALIGTFTDYEQKRYYDFLDLLTKKRFRKLLRHCL